MQALQRTSENDSSPSSEKEDVYACALHEVSNALTVILGWLDLASRADSKEEVLRALEVAREHAHRGHVLARRAIGAEVLSRQSGRSARALAQFASVSVKPQAALKNVEIVVHAGASTDVVLDGEAHLLQVLTNLLLNAIAFSPERGKVEVTLERLDDSIRFVIEDEGPGVPTARVAGLFLGRVSGRKGGAGIGLAHSRALARECGGELALLPSDRGARFGLTWLVSGHSAPRSAFPAALRAALDGARVLVIEDDSAVTTLVEMSLEARGAEVISVSSLSQLRAVLLGKPLVDAVLLDLSPLEGNLTPALHDLRVACPQAVLVLMSGQPGGVPEEAEANFAAWIRKPFDMDQLAQRLGELLQQRRATAS